MTRLLPLFLLLAACSGAKPAPTVATRISLGALPLGDVPTRRAELAPLAAHLEKSTGLPVSIEVAAGYREFSQAVSAQRWDVVMVGAVLYSRAHENGYDAVGIAERGGNVERRGIVVTRAGSKLKAPQDLKGRRVAFVDPHSASGFQYSFASLYAQGLKPEDYAREFLGSHDAVLRAVVEGKVDAGACYDGAIADLLPPEQRGLVVVIDRTDPIPGEVLAVRSDAPPAKAIRDALLELQRNPEAAKPILAPLHGDRLIAPSESLFDSARAIDLLVNEAAGL